MYISHLFTCIDRSPCYHAKLPDSRALTLVLLPIVSPDCADRRSRRWLQTAAATANPVARLMNWVATYSSSTTETLWMPRSSRPTSISTDKPNRVVVAGNVNSGQQALQKSNVALVASTSACPDGSGATEPRATSDRHSADMRASIVRGLRGASHPHHAHTTTWVMMALLDSTAVQHRQGTRSLRRL
jgi:hypothetical protein